ncbi:MAG: hypothetical protein RLY31_252 [Bacteroidota bacterium]|jgi:tryptophan 2,3-dioxygenase
MPMEAVNYSTYLQLEKILNAQLPESDRHGAPAHDEMLFIIIHQTYELWFKQILFEVEAILTTMGKSVIPDNSPDLQTIVHRLNRICVILRVAVHQIDILETMTPMDFLDFRDFLRPASGFQSLQFKLLEARLGLRFEERFGKAFYQAQLKPDEVALLQAADDQPSLLELVDTWLERMPFFDDPNCWPDHPVSPGGGDAVHPFWEQYRACYAMGLQERERGNLAEFDRMFLSDSSDAERNLCAKACRAALFILLYRGYPMLQMPFQLLNLLLETDELLSTWRYRHMNMVHRMIGTRVGTGGSSGKEYLRAALDKHYIFREVAALNSFLIERRNLPTLHRRLEAQLGFSS